MTQDPNEVREAIRASMAKLAANFANRHADRIAANQCCEHVHPTGTRRWRFCAKPAAGKDEHGITYCAGHMPE